MNIWKHEFLFICILCAATSCWGQDQPTSNDLVTSQALREFQAGQFPEAERQFREIVRRDPKNIYAQIYLGQSLFRQGKYADAVDPFEKARNLERSVSHQTNTA